MLLVEAGWAIALLAYVIAVVVGTKALYDIMRRHGLPHNVAVYYNRKAIHVLAGGVVALLVPLLFSEPWIPFVLAFVLALLTYIPHRVGRLMYWFQTEDNMYEVNFCIMWGFSLLILWLLTGDPRVAVFPALLISFGDAVTGIVRNMLFGRRTKHWAGNIAMAALVVPLGFLWLGVWGALAGLIASIVERYEFPPVDDNTLIPLASLAILLPAHFLGFMV
ncbi:MAG TPA: dolichol kinase [Pyrodictiaceae archaeon]|nr:dolichol kinase [Pyrodictiaceae archaeon]